AQVLEAAHALGSPAFSALPGRTAGAPDRFDPRASLPSFIEAVESWFAIRSSGGTPWTVTSQQTAAEFGGRLLDITAQMRSSLRFDEVWQDFTRVVKDDDPRPPQRPRPPQPLSPDPPPPRTYVTEPACNHRLTCSDDMEGETRATGVTKSGVC